MRIKEEFSTNGYRKEDFQHEWQKSIRPHLNIVGSEGCIGDDIVNSKNVFMGFTAKDSENIRYALYTYGGCQDVMDTFACINTSTRVYESAVINKQSDIIVFSYDCW